MVADIEGDMNTHCLITCKVGGEPIKMKIDSGSPINAIAERDFRELVKSGAKLYKPVRFNRTRYYSYDGKKPMSITKQFRAKVWVHDNNPTVVAEFLVIKDVQENLLGRFTAQELKVLQVGISVNDKRVVSSLSDKVQPEPKLKPFPVAAGGQVRFKIDKDVVPSKTPYFRIPIGLEEIVDKKLRELEQMQIIEKVNEHSEWISPMLVVPKGKNDARLVLDMRRPNACIKRIHHTVPVIEDFLPRLSGSEYFSKIDIKNAFHHLELHPDSRPITTFMTSKGMFRFTRLLFGVNCAPELFQRYMEQVLRGVTNCLVMIDDILIYGKEKQHDFGLRETLARLKANNLELNKAKCVFKVKEVDFLGFHITVSGSNPSKEKSEAVRSFRTPESAAEVESFLGLINFLGSYIENLATKQKPLRETVKRAKSDKFVWGKEQQKAFADLKEAIAKAPERTFFDKKAETILYTDASPVGLGAALIQMQENNNGNIDAKTGKIKREPKIIAFAAKSLTPTEQNYAHTQREALAIPWACEKFYMYLIGRHFRLLTDHQALAYLFSRDATTTKRVEMLRANRWAVRVMGYNFTPEWCRGTNNIADVLSRLAVQEPIPFEEDGPHYIASISEWNEIETAQIEEVWEASRKCQVIQKVLNALEKDTWDKELRSYQAVKTELRNVEGLLCRENRVIIPPVLREKILRIAHEGHPGETSMKRDLREKVWWPGMGRAIDTYVASCLGCAAVSKLNPPEELIMSKLPTTAWEKVGIDFTSFSEHNVHLLVVIDYYSRYVEVRTLTITDADRTIEALEDIFYRWGVPTIIISDNGQPFASKKFEDYMKARGIIHDRTTPYTPNQNGEVERQNRGIKKCLKIAKLEGTNWKRALKIHINAYNNRPHSTTGKAPSELMTGRILRGKIIDLRSIQEGVDDDWKTNDATQKLKAKLYADARRKARPAAIGKSDIVMLRNQESGKLQPTFDPVPYQVLEKTGGELLVQKMTEAEDCQAEPVTRRHVTQAKLWPRQEADLEKENKTSNDNNSREAIEETSEKESVEDETTDVEVPVREMVTSEKLGRQKRKSQDECLDEHQVRRSKRVRKPNQKYVGTISEEILSEMSNIFSEITDGL